MAFHTLLKSFGVNEETADEVMRQGISSIDALKRFNSDRLKNTIQGISKNKSPDCPEPDKVFLGATFEDKLNVLIEWIKFQKIIGGSAAEENTTKRVLYLEEVKASEGTDDIKLPEKLKALSEYRDWSDHLAIEIMNGRQSTGNLNLSALMASLRDASCIPHRKQS